MGWPSFLVAAVTGAVVLSSCGASDPQGDADAPASALENAVAGNGGSPTESPIWEVTPGSGPQVPVFDRGIVTASQGIAVSTAPTLSAEGLPGGQSGSWRFEVYEAGWPFDVLSPVADVSQGGPTASLAGTNLVPGGSYLWWATGSDGQRQGPHVMSVRAAGAAGQDTVNFAGVAVGASSGELTLGWTSQVMTAVSGAAGVGLVFSAGTPAQPGLPSGWALDLGVPYTYVEVVGVGPKGVESVALVRATGTRTVYRLTGDVFEPVQVPGQPSVVGVAPTLVANPDGSWTATSPSGSVVSYAPATAPGETAWVTEVSSGSIPMVAPVFGEQGRLSEIVDPVSGRSVTMAYGGSNECGQVPAGAVPAPAGALCAMRFWDDSSAEVIYGAGSDSEPQIVRLIAQAQAGSSAQVTDIGYDSVGRVTRLRSPLASAAVAAGVYTSSGDDDSTVIEYDDSGRVRVVRAPASQPGGDRAWREFVYGVDDRTQVMASGEPTPAGFWQQVVYQPDDFQVVATTDGLGRVTASQFNESGQVIATTDAQGAVTTWTYDSRGRIDTKLGPSFDAVNPTTSPLLDLDYDESYDRVTEGELMSGLQVQLWDNDQFSGSPVATEIGPLVAGQLWSQLSGTWPAPTGVQGAWSVRLSGVALVGDAQDFPPGEYQFTTPDSTNTQLYVNNQLCVAGRCTPVTVDPSIGVTLRVDAVFPQGGDGAISVQVTDPSGRTRAVPVDSTSPDLGVVTEAKQVLSLNSSSQVQGSTKTAYANVFLGQVGQTIGADGVSSLATFEPVDPSTGQFGRQLSSALPAGNAYSWAYYGAQESLTPPCKGAEAAVQGGLRSTITAPADSNGNQVVSQSWYDDAGRVVAVRAGEKAKSQCTVYDDAGRVIATFSDGGSKRIETKTTYEVDGNPLVTRTETINEFTGFEGVTTTVVDILGQTVAITDAWGTNTVIGYDASTGMVVSRDSVTRRGQPLTLDYGYDSVGRSTSVSVNNTPVATMSYNDRGLLDNVTYGNGVVTTVGYDTNVHANSSTYAFADGSSGVYTRSLDPHGRVLGTTLELPTATTQFDYGYDALGRLTQAELAVTGDLNPVHNSWNYTYDDNSNRTSVTIDGTSEFLFGYDDADRLTSSNLPTMGTIEYNAEGSLTGLGEQLFTYDDSGMTVGIADGINRIEYLRDGSGNLMGTRANTADGNSEMRYTAGMILDADDNRVATMVNLPGAVQLVLDTNNAGTWTFLDTAGNRMFSTSDAGTSPSTSRVALYDPFGNPLTPAASDPNGPNTGTYGYRAAENHSTQTALTIPVIDMGARVYLPVLGRFTATDPTLGGSANAYDYASQDPVNNSDPDGEALWVQIVGGVTTAFAAMALVAATGGGMLVGIAVGAIVSAAGSAGTEYVSQLADDGEVTDSSAIVTAAGIGAALGAIGGGIQGAAAARAARLAQQARPAVTRAEIEGELSLVRRQLKDVNSASKQLEELRASVKKVKDPAKREALKSVTSGENYRQLEVMRGDLIERKAELSAELATWDLGDALMMLDP